MTDLAIIRSLARTGAAERAWAAFADAGLERVADDPRLLCLKGRLLKDRAMRVGAPADRAQLLRAAAEAYGEAARLGTDTYSRINAATLVYLRGDRAAAAALAADVLAMLDSGEHEAETPYWIGATRAEALLLMGRLAEAQRALADAVTLAPAAREDRAVTLRQFRRILAVDGADDSWISAHDLAPVLHFRGAMRLGSDTDVQLIRQAVLAVKPGLAYGALAAGADIVAAEAALEVGAELHIVLPAAPDLFRAESVAPLGADWGPRFDRLVNAAATLECLDEAGGLTHSAMVLGEWMALGLAVQEARLGDAQPVLIEAINRQDQGGGPWRFPHELRLLRLSAPAGPGGHDLPPPDEPSIWIARPGDNVVDPLPLSIAVSLLETLPPGTVIDVDALGASGGEPPRFAALRRLDRPHALVASRPAALVLETICEGCRSVLVGETAGTGGPVDVYDLLLKSAQ
jgi:hypothetical protein